MMSVTNIGVSSTHWQYSTNMLTSNKTVLQNKQTKTVDVTGWKRKSIIQIVQLSKLTQQQQISVHLQLNLVTVFVHQARKDLKNITRFWMRLWRHHNRSLIQRELDERSEQFPYEILITFSLDDVLIFLREN